MLDFGLTVLHKVVRVLANPTESRPTSPAKDPLRTAGLSTKGRDSDMRDSLGISGVGILGILVEASSDRQRVVVVLKTGAMLALAEPREARMMAEEN
jgi:hypothetical protein